MSINKAAQALTDAVEAYLRTVKGGGLGRRPITHKSWKKPIGESLGISKVYQKRIDEVVDYCTTHGLLVLVEKDGKQFFSLPQTDESVDEQEFDEEVLIEFVDEEDDGVLIWFSLPWIDEGKGKWVSRSQVFRLRRDAHQKKACADMEAGKEQSVCTICESHQMDVYLNSRGFYACGACNDICPSSIGIVESITTTKVQNVEEDQKDQKEITESSIEKAS